MSEEFWLSGSSRLWVQKWGCLHPWEYWGCYAVGDISAPEGDTTLFHCADSRRSRRYQVIGSYQGAPGPVTTSIEVPRKVRTELLKLRCPFNLMVRDTKCERPDDPLGWETMLYLHNVRITNRGIASPVSREADDEGPQITSADVAADYWLQLKQLSWGSVTGLGTFVLNDVAFCDDVSCGDVCGTGSSGCQVGWVVGDGGSPGDAPLIKTEDGGVTWYIHASPFPDSTDDMTSVTCAGDYALVTNGDTASVAYTEDGGASWTVVSTGFDGGAPLQDAYMHNRQNIWVVGAGGYVYFSDDGGVSWEVQEDGGNALNAVHGLGANIVYAVGNGGVVLKTKNGGLTWASTSSPTANALNTVYVISRDVVFVGGTDGLWYSTDGGSSWTQSGDLTDVYDLTFCGCDFGFAAAGSDVYRTIDGGHSWQVQVTGGVANLYAVWCCDPNEAFAVGDNGQVFMGTSGKKSGTAEAVHVIGLEWNQSTDTWTGLDQAGNSLSWTQANFNAHPIWGGMTRVNLAADGTVNAVYGDPGYAEDGSNGRVMVRIPKFWVKADSPAANVYRWWVSDKGLAGFEIHPAFYQRDHVGAPADYIYVGAYEADLVPDAGGSHTLHSRPGKQPMTGGAIFEVPFDAGTNEPDVGDLLDSNLGDNGWTCWGYEVTSGTWADNDAVGKLWIGKINDADPSWSDDDTITNATQAGETVCTQNGADSGLHFDIDEAEDYANQIGTGWGATNIWSRQAMLLLQAIEWGNLDSQSELGRDIVDKASGAGFNGELTGSYNVNDNLDSQLTGAGDDGLAGEAQDGLRPVTWRGIENPWGNVWEFIIGYNALDAEYRIVKKAGLASATMDGTLGAGDYDTSTATPQTSDGYISDIEWEDLLEYLFIPSAVAGSDSEYIPDYCYGHDATEVNILLAGGWAYASLAGAACFISDDVVSKSARSIGARCEFLKQ